MDKTAIHVTVYGHFTQAARTKTTVLGSQGNMAYKN
ncbi:hypothetical protein CCACVL1_29718 [Corchorus capsularis]|uniref:Uncharacterized protein n=1 Tax=Corchorus capsularis TaxID=210143 RepID=A0A1R3G0E9_COCAP|nr:hypothetical protein CCACVL1_29718 [Corchorus capsularis]